MKNMCCKTTTSEKLELVSFGMPTIEGVNFK
jgi:hypothetical protein